MSTIAAALQILTSTPTVEPVNPVTSLAAADLAGDDFVAALTQALAAVAPAAAAVQSANVIAPSTPSTAEPVNEEEPLDVTELAASLAGFLSLPALVPAVPAVPVQVVTEPAGAGIQPDPLDLLGLATNSVRGGDAQQLTLATALTLPTTDNDLKAAVGDVAQPAATDQSAASLLLAPPVDKPVATANPAAADAVAARPLHSSVGTPAWSEELSTRVTVMAERGQHSASLRLSPEHLGPLEIRIAIRDDQASVWFGAAHADTRAAIEHALPRLREMFAAQGMSLTDTGVSREPPREQQQTSRPLTADSESTTETQVTMTTLQRIGLIDAYA